MDGARSDAVARAALLVHERVERAAHRSRQRPGQCGRTHPVQLHAPEVAKVMTWASETYYAVDLAPVQVAFPDVVDFAARLERSGRTQLMAQLDSVPL
ncbi:hypothetical protein [Streptomyces sp. NPDC058307]|uniref:hypothetical protein n=1 Tax=Streptomyces sp. NPDC058307 TaxID=3346439 RepID=UPI0036E63EE9